jgi:hypothetical protein
VAALGVITILTGLAIIWNVQSQGVIAQVIFVAAFLGLPALVWGAAVILANRLSARHLDAIRTTETQACTIILDQRDGTLMYQTSSHKQQQVIPYRDVRRAHVTPAIGASDAAKVYLTLETREGRVVLLGEELGTHNQKADLALEIETAIQQYLKNQIPPSKREEGI